MNRREWFAVTIGALTAPLLPKPTIKTIWGPSPVAQFLRAPDAFVAKVQKLSPYEALDDLLLFDECYMVETTDGKIQFLNRSRVTRRYYGKHI